MHSFLGYCLYCFSNVFVLLKLHFAACVCDISECENSIAHCSKCDSRHKCTSCVAGFSLNGGKCQSMLISYSFPITLLHVGILEFTFNCQGHIGKGLKFHIIRRGFEIQAKW